MNNLVALCAVGAERILGNEIKHLGYKLISNAPGRVTFSGDNDAMFRANLCLRTSDRVFLQLAAYKAENFDDLFIQLNGKIILKKIQKLQLIK